MCKEPSIGLLPEIFQYFSKLGVLIELRAVKNENNSSPNTPARSDKLDALKKCSVQSALCSVCYS
jgi:hypothetical protein